jgi:hypothetical protein
MIVHVVLFRLFPRTPKEKIDAMTSALNDLKIIIPELMEIHAGVNFSMRRQGYDVMLVSRFKNENDLRVYSDHPAHKKVIAEYIEPIRESVIVGDMEL